MAQDFVSMRLTGGRELQRALLALPQALAKSVLRAAARKALTPVERRAWELAPKDRGDLADSIKIATISRRSGGAVGDLTMGVGPTKDHFYGMFHEFGTIKLAARPWLRPAWDQNVGKAQGIYGKEVWKALARAARRHARRS